MRLFLRSPAIVSTALGLVGAVAFLGRRLDRDMGFVHLHEAQGGVLLPTPGATRDGTVVRGLFKF
jgi:hypothetical protein